MPNLSILAKPTSAVGINTYASLKDVPNRRTFFGQSLAEMERSALSATGSVRLVLGPKFPTSFSSATLAQEHAARAGGSVAVMFRSDGGSGASDAATGRFVLHRVYSPEVTGSLLGTRLDVKPALIESNARMRNVHPALISLVTTPPRS